MILATGFRNLGGGDQAEPFPPLLRGLAPELPFTGEGHVAVNRDYSVDLSAQASGGGLLFLNGLCETSHGLGDAGSFSLLSIRAGTIAEAIAKRLRRPARRPRQEPAAGARRVVRTAAGGAAGAGPSVAPVDSSPAQQAGAPNRQHDEAT